MKLLFRDSMTACWFKSLSTNIILNYMIIVMAFLIPLSIAGYTILSGIIAIVWIIEGKWDTKWNMISGQPVFKVIGIFYLFLSLSLLWSENLIQGLEHLRKYYLLFLIPILYTSVDRQRIPKIISAFLSAMIISEILSYLIFFDLMPFKYKESWSSIDPSPFMHHTPYSIFLIFSIFLMVIRLLKKDKNTMQTILYTFFIITMTINLFINAGRTGQFSLLIALIVFLSQYWRFSPIKTLLTASVIASFVFSIAYVASPNFHQRANETYYTVHYLFTNGKPLNDSTGFRFMMWQTAGVIIAEHPLIGVGVGDDRDAFHEVLATKLPDLKEHINGFSDFHNTYVQIAVYSGVIGLILFGAIFFTILRNLDADRDLKGIGAIMTTLLLLFMLIGYFPAAYLTILFVLIIGITLKRGDQYDLSAP